MKITKTRPFASLLSTALLFSLMLPASARESLDASYLQEAVPEAPKTAAEKLQNLQSRHEQAFSELTVSLTQLPVNPALLGTKQLFTQIDDSVREMKNIRSGCSSLMLALRAELKTITGSSSFTDEQKQDLATSAETLAAECNGLSGKLDLAVERLGAAYTVFPRWNKIHKAYTSLQGHAKAAEQVKTHVEDYLKSFVPEPEQSAADNKSQDT